MLQINWMDIKLTRTNGIVGKLRPEDMMLANMQKELSKLDDIIF
jgi:hypothetical protein